MHFSRALNDAYANARPEIEPDVPPGWHAARVISTEAISASTGSPGLRVEFALLEAPNEGVILGRVFWLTEAAIARSKRDLETIGFRGLPLEEIAAFARFDSLHRIRVRVGHGTYQGQRRTELQGFATAEEGAPANSEAQGPSSSSNAR